MLSLLSLAKLKELVVLALFTLFPTSETLAAQYAAYNAAAFLATEEIAAPVASEIAIKYALKLEVDPFQLTNEDLYHFIDEWIGTRYRYGGKSKSGIDCSGFSSTLYEAVYQKSFSGSSRSIYTLVAPLEKNELTEGDLVFFKIRKNQISHVGVYLHNDYFVHASTEAGVIISSLNEPYYKKYFYKGGRLTNNEK